MACSSWSATKDDTEQSAFLIATSEGHRELLELTLAAGADVRSLDSYRGTGVIRAAERGHADVVGRLLAAGVDPVDRGAGSAQADRRLLEAAERGDADEAALALRHGADVETRNDRQQTPLLVAAAADKVDVARLLVHLGPIPTPWTIGTTPRGWSPESPAVWRCSRCCCRPTPT
ncbi:ankyrin repeat domain-containing protein [Propionibacteriaceae bacterium Y1685]